MTSTQIFADEIAALMPDSRIARLRDEQDVTDLAALLACAFGVGALQMQIAAALSQRCRELAQVRAVPALEAAGVIEPPRDRYGYDPGGW